jgi:predicted phage-related endonuclease
MSITELTAKVKELRELKAMADELSGEITFLEDAIKAEMTARNTDELQAGMFKVRWTRITSNRFDSSAFKAAAPAIYAQYTKAVETRRFTVV